MNKDKTQQASKETTTLLSSWLARKKNNGAFGSTRTNILGRRSSPLLSNQRLSFDLVATEQRDIILGGAEESRPPRTLQEEANVDLDHELDFCLDSLGRTPTGESSSLAEVGGRPSPVPSQSTPLEGGKPLPKHETTQNLPPPPTEGLGVGKERESAVDIEADIEQVSVPQRHQSRPGPLEVITICMSSDCYEYFERALDDTHITRCPACRAKQLLSNQRQEEKQQGWVALDMPSTLRNRLFSETIDINFGTGSMSIDRKYRPEPIMIRTMLWDLTHWFGQFQVMICRWRMRLQRTLTERVVPVRLLDFLKVTMSRGTNAGGALKDIVSDEEIVYMMLIDTLDNEGERPWFNIWLSRIGNKFQQQRKLGGNIKRLEWTCVSHKLLRFLILLQNTDTTSQKCGHRSHDDFQELSQGAILELANDMFEAGYITHAQISNQTNSPITSLTTRVQNIFIGARRRISSLRTPTLPTFNTKPSSIKSIPLQCLPSTKCRWLHMCLKKPPYATKLEPLHVCKDDEENDFTDATFFQALRRAYFGSKRWRERLLFKLKKIEFVEFELCPENLVDHILPNKLPPTLDEYDFLPPPPVKKCPPIGASHMMHLFTSCSAQPLDTSLYLRYIPKRKELALSFRPDLVDAITGWGLHFVEGLNSALAVTVMFSVSLVLGIVFAICWSVWKQDVQGAFGVASYVTSVITLAVMTWQMWTV
ncbi:uncharacterized protein K444DRAFT_430978 [Hyaloscypha bicolor E]|uniref:Uncharacterized protein n=1 Tax=Hyaloscypha bicolor E TaxID=1095630 RepID=A0A2J6T5W5_9HELO|nr:uncharacterized protein K444DRAFT_430978 [Hyaloscypha bicolor E]PMD58343.1 hypothetical protein K444DRAFT_430978 [Hyaloscypha bicolor E]